MKQILLCYIMEDDKDLSSTFFYDITKLCNKKMPVITRYHAKHFYGNWDMKITDTVEMKPIRPLNKKKSSASVYKDFRKWYRTNAERYRNHKIYLYFAGHAYYIYKYVNWKLPTILNGLFRDKSPEILFLDSCYLSETRVLSDIQDCRYVVTMQTPSPNFGLITEKFIDYLHANTSLVTKGRKIIDDFIDLNNSEKDIFRKKLYRTDCNLIDMEKYREFMEEYKQKIRSIKRTKKCLTERSHGWHLYDIRCMLLKNGYDVNDEMDKVVVYRKANRLAQKYDKNNIATGISTYKLR